MYHLLAIPIAIGIIAGGILVFLPEEREPTGLTASRLAEGGSPVLGQNDAPVTILEWGDYQCTYCYKFHRDTLDVIKEDFVDTGRVKIIFKDFPLNGQDSILAAEASYCAHDQGKYWEYHDELYGNWGGERTGWITRKSLESFASTVGLDLQEFGSCLDERKHMERISQMHSFGREIGIDATPSFLVFNGEEIVKIRGNQPLEVFLRTIGDL